MIAEQTTEVAGIDCRFFEAGGGEPGSPVVYVHGVPNTGKQWAPFLERTGGVAPDLPGFGASGKPSDFDYSIGGYAAWLGDFLDDRGIGHYRVVCHDWGGAALALAQMDPARVDRLVVMDSVPLLPGYRWHVLARRWRTPLIGELAMGFTLKRAARRLMRQPDDSPLPAEEFDELWAHFDHGTQRAILKLYRSAPEPVLEAAGRNLGTLTCPALMVWGDSDPYLDERFAHDYADALGGETEVDVVAGGGHWPWHQDVTVIDRVADFLSG